MKPINWSRLILGGIVAGVIVNVSEFIYNAIVEKEAWAEAMKALGKSMEGANSGMGIWILWSFLFGVGAVWLYAAIRPRYGPGPGTAVCAGLAAWFFTHFLFYFGNLAMQLFPNRLMNVGILWTLGESVIATLAGAWIYQEA